MSADHVWALVTNGMRAHILRDLELSGGEKPRPLDLVMRARADTLRAHVDGSANSPPDALSEPRDILRADLDPFAAEVAAELDRHRLAGDFNSLAVFAPQAVARALNRQMTPGLASTIFLEHPPILLPIDEKTLRETVRRAIGPAAKG